MKTKAVILAAGQGTRMRSSLPKVLHKVAGKPFVRFAVEAVNFTGETPVVVIGHGGQAVREELGEEVQFAVQSEQLGTAHAVQMAEEILIGQSDLVLITSADMPLMRSETLQAMVAAQEKNSGPITMLTVVSDNPRGFGRIIRGDDGDVLAIVEEAQATEAQLSIKELNVGAYCIRADWLWRALTKIKLSPKGEYYVTDLVEIAVSDEQKVQAMIVEDQAEVIGINTRVHLSEAEALFKKRINEKWMLAGVTIINPGATYIEESVQIGQDSILYPGTFLRGETIIGEGCEIGPNAIIESTQIGDNCIVLESVLEYAVLEDDVTMGPFGHLRKGAHLAKGVHLGNFGEVKNSYIGQNSKMGHFSYIGNAEIGENVNIGAGTITCNYDGQDKHLTKIGSNVFLGSDTMLVAPVELGEGARTGAGAVVTHDVAKNELVIGVPAKPFEKKGKSE
ncbi:MAG: bifunctional UDP-N-acetylglucosamine diphosphorylase/glucosamine-1-phosphate N-acetyltransferase GlmU [Anaerolineaceae bacterium]|nr:bifunctional UDP-N-acetylglucosamine diphosphorylase/glucosamine-1-phosphate N-acetyltransferase GlmU [Anaerolineaceae bacterium]